MGFTHTDTAIVQATSSVASQSVTLSSAVSVGDVICLLWGSPATGSDTISDNSPGGSNTWVVPTAGVNHNAFAYTIATMAAPSGITITITGGGSGTRFIVADRFSVTGGSAVYSGDADSTGTGTSGNCGSISGVPAGELLWGSQHTGTGSATYTAGSSNSVAATIGSQVGNGSGSGFSQYILSGAGGTESLTWSSNISVSSNLSSWEAYFIVVAGGGQPYQLIAPGRLSPMALGVPLSAPSPAPQSPPSGQGMPAPQPMPPGLQSPMALAVPLSAPSPAPQAPPSGQAVPPPLTPPGRLSPMALAFAMLPGTAQAAPVPPPPPQPALAPLTPPGLQSPMALGTPLMAPSPAPQSPPSGQAVPLPLTPPGLQSPMGIRLYAPSPAPQTQPAVIPPPGPAAGTGPLTPPGRLSPMALAVPLSAPSPAPQSPPVPQPYRGRGQVLIAWGSEPFAAPVWTDVTPWVRLDRPLSMQRGRQDNIGVIPAGRLTLTADNSDGRFTAGRSGSPWAPNVKIGRRLQVNIPDEAGVLHTRFDGLVTELPAQWQGGPGLENLAVIQAADILAWVARQPNLLSWTQQEMLADSPVALWSLADASNGTQATDQAGQGAAPLKVVSQGDGTGAAASGSGVPLVEVQTSNIVTQQQTTIVFTFANPGAFTWIAPLGTLVNCDVICTAGGKAGANGTSAPAAGAGGNGGEEAEEPALAVTPGNVYTGTVGAAGAPSGGSGGDTTFAGDSVTVTAHGSGSGSTNTKHHSGGTGALTGPSNSGGGGGSAGGTYQPGNNGVLSTAGSAVTGGGAGGAGDTTFAGGTPGSAPGGGGGGGAGDPTAPSQGGSGAAGQVVITTQPIQSTLFMLNNPRGRTAIAVWVTSGNHLQLASTGSYGTRSPVWTTVDAGQVPSGPFHVAVDVAAGTGVATLRVNNVSAGTLTLPAGASYTQVTVGGSYGAWLGGWNGSAGLAAIYPAPLGATRTGVHYQAGTTGFAGSSTGTMISKIASYTGLPSFYYTPPSGPSDPSYGLTLASYYNLNGQQPLAAMQLYETAEAGVLYVNAAGQLIFADRASRYAAGSAGSPAFVLSAGQYEPDTHFKVNDQYLLTAACYATSHIPGGYPVTSAAAKLDYGPYTQNAGSPGSPQSAPFADATGTANAYSADDIMDAGWWQVNVNGQPVPRVPSLTVDLLTQPASEFSIASFYATDIGSALQLAGLPSQAPDNAGQPLSAYHVIEGINETLSLTAHTVQLYTSPLAQNAAWIAGDSLLGVIGTTDAIGRSQAPAALGPPYGAPPTFGPALNRTGSVGAQDMRTLTVNTQNRLTPPLAIAQQQAAQTLTTLAGQAVTWDTLLADTAGGFGNLTTYTVQPGYAGNYLCLAVVQAATGITNLGGVAAWFAAVLGGVASQWGAAAIPYLSAAPYTAIALAQRIGPCAAGDTIQVVTAASYTTPPASVPLGTADGGSMFALIWQGT